MKITVKSLKQQGKKSFEAQVSNLAELKVALAENNIAYDNSKIMLKNTGATLEADSAILPNEDLFVYIYPVQVKAGMGVKADKLQEIADKFKEAIEALEGLADIVDQEEEAVSEDNDDWDSEEDEDEDLEELDEDDLEDMNQYGF